MPLYLSTPVIALVEGSYEEKVPLAEVAAEQPVFRFSETEGTLAGFYTPSLPL